MKIILLICLLATLSYSQIYSETSAANGYEYLGVYSNRVLQYWPPEALAKYLGIPGYLNTNYNVFFLTFWLSTGSADTALIWQDPLMFFSTENPFGKTKEEIQANIIDRYHKAGKKLLVSAFGATEFPATAGKNATLICNQLADYVLQNKLDGVDLDFEDNDSFESGIAEAWLIECTKVIRKKLPKGRYLLTHAPQAPYFVGKPHYKNGGYLTIHKEVGSLIDYYNIQFYNQGSSKYDTYDSLFKTSGGEWPGSAVLEMLKNGIDKKKIIIGKPVNTGDATNTGWISAANFGDWAKQAASDPEIQWDGGMFTWQLSSDISGYFINEYVAHKN